MGVETEQLRFERQASVAGEGVVERSVRQRSSSLSTISMSGFRFLVDDGESQGEILEEGELAFKRGPYVQFPAPACPVQPLEHLQHLRYEGPPAQYRMTNFMSTASPRYMVHIMLDPSARSAIERGRDDSTGDIHGVAAVLHASDAASARPSNLDTRDSVDLPPRFAISYPQSSRVDDSGDVLTHPWSRCHIAPGAA